MPETAWLSVFEKETVPGICLAGIPFLSVLFGQTVFFGTVCLYLFAGGKRKMLKNPGYEQAQALLLETVQPVGTETAPLLSQRNLMKKITAMNGDCGCTNARTALFIS